jgi:uncharacterized damage-inducible protein DinB
VPRPLKLGIEDLRSLVEYDRAVFDRFVRRIRRLPWTAATRKRGIGHESLFDTLIHVLNVREVWFAYIIRGRNSDEELEALFQETRRHPVDWKGFHAYARRVWAEVDRTVAGMTPARASRPVSVFWMAGRYTVRDAFLQASFEQAHHLGEIIGALWQDDLAPPPMTWIDVRRGLGPRRRSRN